MSSHLTAQRVEYVHDVLGRLGVPSAPNGQKWVSRKQAVWLQGAISEASKEGANGDRGGPEHRWVLRCCWNIHEIVRIAIAPNHAGLVTMAATGCNCAVEALIAAERDDPDSTEAFSADDDRAYSRNHEV